MKIDSSVTAVTVYPDRARVTRHAQVSLEVGTHELELMELTSLLDPDSVRAGGKGTARVRILGVEVRKEYYVEPPSVPAVELEKQLQDKKDEERALQDEEDMLRAELQVLKGIGEHAGSDLARGIGRGRIGVDDGNALLIFLEGHYRRIHDRIREIARSRRHLANQIRVIAQELERIRGAGRRERYTASVEMQALSAGDFDLELEYTTTGGASWRPLYDLRVTRGETPDVEITCWGQVQQSTGEDWQAVELVLSTARPAVSAQLPELKPWYVGIARPRPPLRAAPTMRKAGMTREVAELSVTFAEAEVGAPPAPVPAEVMSAQVETDGSAVTFRIPRRADIPADNTPHKVMVQQLQLEPQLDFLTIPKLTEEVYRRARVLNDSPVAFLPGPISLFYQDEFVGHARMARVAPQETFEVTLGLEERIKVKRELALREVSKRFIGDRRVQRFAYQIEVQNLLPHAAQVVVQDQVPVATHEEIKIRLEDASPPPTETDDMGKLTWNLELESQEKAVIRFEFTVNAPRDMILDGLPE